MASMSLNGISRTLVRMIVGIAIFTAVGIWLSVGLQLIGLRSDTETRQNARAVCVAIANSYNIQLGRQRRDTAGSPLDSLPFVQCAPGRAAQDTVAR